MHGVVARLGDQERLGVDLLIVLPLDEAVPLVRDVLLELTQVVGAVGRASPSQGARRARFSRGACRRVGTPGFEPGTSCSQSRHANQAALRPVGSSVDAPSAELPMRSDRDPVAATRGSSFVVMLVLQALVLRL